ncbi:universal stress protein [Pontibacter sp. 172403-2]|uniref:universal stress protein n=1 Tax=Pontibacter rufus TaxID=2791028 RepID=UPI0018AFE338|nr:universal stress protein [Pontibacter sp. 172403-2]MBF9252330.1 universal stress protein [Pontibacter sp. 172403-2]
MYKILLPVDFTEGTNKTCHYALRLAGTLPHAQLLLLHCHQDYLADADETPPVPMTASEAQAERVLHRNETSAANQLEVLYQELLQEAETSGQQVLVERALVHGFPEDKIVEEAQQYKPDLVIMSTKGESGLARSFFGTVTTKVVQDLNVPVLTIPDAFGGSDLRNVIYATDFDKTDSSAIRQLQDLLQPYAPNVYCVHVSDEAEPQQDRAQMAGLREKLQREAPAQNIRYTLLEGDHVADTLQQFVQEHNIDLIALTTHKRGMLSNMLHSSLAQELVLNSEVPLLVFHSTAKA